MRQRMKFFVLGLATTAVVLQISACAARFLGDFLGDAIVLGAV